MTNAHDKRRSLLLFAKKRREQKGGTEKKRIRGILSYPILDWVDTHVSNYPSKPHRYLTFGWERVIIIKPRRPGGWVSGRSNTGSRSDEVVCGVEGGKERAESSLVGGKVGLFDTVCMGGWGLSTVWR